MLNIDTHHRNIEIQVDEIHFDIQRRFRMGSTWIPVFNPWISYYAVDGFRDVAGPPAVHFATRMPWVSRAFTKLSLWCRRWRVCVVTCCLVRRSPARRNLLVLTHTVFQSKKETTTLWPLVIVFSQISTDLQFYYYFKTGTTFPIHSFIYCYTTRVTLTLHLFTYTQTIKTTEYKTTIIVK